MTGLAADVLAAWLVLTVSCSALLGLVVAGQAAVARARRALRSRRAAAGPTGEPDVQLPGGVGRRRRPAA